MANIPWKSPRCQKLVRHYVAKKPIARSGNTRVMTRPRFIAGMLLAAHGEAAYEAFCVIQQQHDQGWPKEAGAMLRHALNDELRAVHGQVACKFCHRLVAEDDDMLDWMTTVARAWWACPDCVEAQGLRYGDDAQQSGGAAPPEAG